MSPSTPPPIPHLPTAKAVQELRALYRISQTVGASLDLTTAVAPVLRILAEELGMQRGTLALLNPDTGELAIEVAHGLTPAERRRGRYRVGEGVMGRVLERGEPMVIPSIGSEPLFLDRTGARRSLDRSRVAFLCVPVKVGGETVGVLSADRLPEAGEDLEDDLRVLTIVAGLVAQAVHVQQMVRREKEALLKENRRLREALDERFGLESLAGESPARRAVAEQVRLAARTRVPVLITGERGTGRSFVARAIHVASDRRWGPFVEVTCGAGSPEALEETLFGPDGAVAAAREGTLFLDGVELLAPGAQERLLGFLQGSRTGSRPSGVRVVAAGSSDLPERVRHGRFRADLYRRLGGIPVHLPPLRQSREDVPAFVQAFLRRHAPREMRFSAEAEALLMRYPWPGNLPELEGVVRHAADRAEGGLIRPEHLPARVRTDVPADLQGVEEVLARWADRLLERRPPEGVYRAAIDRLDRVLVRRALARSGGVKLEAARLLGINRNTLYSKLERMDEG